MVEASTTERQPTCAELVDRAWQSRREDLEDMLCTDNADYDAFNEYGLCFDYVAPGTFNDQHTGFWRYQISFGGPSEEIRFYGAPTDVHPARIEFWYLDWFDGAPLDVTDDEIAQTVWAEFFESDSVVHAYEEAMG